MDSRRFIKIIMVLLSITMFGCMPTDAVDCNDSGNQTEVAGLIKFTPIQTAYNVGDEVTVSVNIPSKNYFFGQYFVDIFNETNDNYGRFTYAMWDDESINPNTSLFLNNQIEFIYGDFEDEENRLFKMPYFEENDEYKIKFKVKLNRVGNYIIPKISSRILFQGSSECNRLFIETDTENPLGGDILFTVQ